MSVTTDFIEIELIGTPHNSRQLLKDPNANPENIWTGKVIDSPNGSIFQKNSTVFLAKIFTLNSDDPSKPRHFAHRNAVIAVE